MTDRHAADLRRLALLHGVQPSWREAVTERRVRASDDSLIAVLGALGAPVARIADVPGALRERREAHWREALEPVAVAWDGEPASIELRLPARLSEQTARFSLRLEGGGARRWSADLSRARAVETARIGRERFVARRIALPAGLPPGRHALTVSVGAGSRMRASAHVLSAPSRAWSPPGGARQARWWGVFAPVYALRSSRSRGAGDLTDLASLSRRVGRLGGGIVATLPLLAAFLDEPFEPSPYSPASRLAWNELYLDPRRLPEFRDCPRARELLGSAPARDDLARLEGRDEVDYRAVMAHRRRVLEALAERFFERSAGRRAGLEEFLRRRPEIGDYARFRATVDRRRESWRVWPARLRSGRLRAGDWDEPARLYHLYVQWRAEEQIGAIARAARRRGPGLYLDLPLGVHPDGFDVWRERDAFALGAAGGAPPDAFFTKGQDWGFPPLHPGRIRRDGYRYVAACLRHHMSQAGILRVDHVMGLHRLFWVPAGRPASEGVYVRYRAEELYALMSLESHRARTIVVGEDLGTVPEDVRPAMDRHGIGRMHVLQYEMMPGARPVLPRVPAGSLATLNTHDMPPFSAWLKGEDIADRASMGLLDAAGARREARERDALRRRLIAYLRRGGWLRAREADDRRILRACLERLGASGAAAVVASLEDLWGETRPQNTPGTRDERPNWRRRLRHGLGEIFTTARLLDPLKALDRSRRRTEAG